jgi:hypothetical protein
MKNILMSRLFSTIEGKTRKESKFNIESGKEVTLITYVYDVFL